MAAADFCSWRVLTTEGIVMTMACNSLKIKPVSYFYEGLGALCGLLSDPLQERHKMLLPYRIVQGPYVAITYQAVLIYQESLWRARNPEINAQRPIRVNHVIPERIAFFLQE